MSNAEDQQKAYYEKTAADYDKMHLQEPEHEFALSQLLGLMRYFNFQSLLDVGSGTGRVIRHAKHDLPFARIGGIEPVEGLRKVAYSEGVQESELTGGNALDLQYEDNSWDIVCAFGILHHISTPELAVKEMCRVARYGVFFSDLNNYGCGSFPQRSLSQILRSLRLWRSFQYVKNGGKFEKFSEGDGVHYSYSIFDSIPTIKNKFNNIHLTNTRGNSPNLFRGCSHISVFAVRDENSLQERREAIGRTSHGGRVPSEIS